jgi:hypothetical protein
MLSWRQLNLNDCQAWIFDKTAQQPKLGQHSLLMHLEAIEQDGPRDKTALLINQHYALVCRFETNLCYQLNRPYWYVVITVYKLQTHNSHINLGQWTLIYDNAQKCLFVQTCEKQDKVAHLLQWNHVYIAETNVKNSLAEIAIFSPSSSLNCPRVFVRCATRSFFMHCSNFVSVCTAQFCDTCLEASRCEDEEDAELDRQFFIKKRQKEETLTPIQPLQIQPSSKFEKTKNVTILNCRPRLNYAVTHYARSKLQARFAENTVF